MSTIISPAERYFGTRTGRHTHPVTHPAWLTFTESDCVVCQPPAQDAGRRGGTVLDGTHGNAVTHDCAGSWILAGQNAAGHDVFACDAGRHLYVAQHRSADHKCLTVLDCVSVVVAS